MQKNSLTTLLTGTIGTILEWAEYAFYGYMAVPIAAQFFPETSQSAHLLAAFAVFAAGFVMRPLGAVLFGHIGDRIGRKRALLISMLLMGLATLAIGCLPAYQSIGIAAPILLVMFRLLQGLAVSSECLAAAVFLIEHSPKPYRTLAGSWSGFAAAVGMTLGGVAAAIVTHPSMPGWAWRVPFFVGALGCIVALILRQRVHESPEFVAAQAQDALSQYPIHEILHGHSLALFRTASFAIFTGSMIYVGNMYFNTFLTQYVGIVAHDATRITTLGELLVVMLFPFVAWWADKTDGVKIMKAGLLFTLFSAPASFAIASMGSIQHAVFAQVLYAISDALVTAPMFYYLYKQFPLHVRVTGMAVPWNVAIALLGGTGPMFAQSLFDATGWFFVPGVYISFSALFVYVMMQLKSRKTTLVETNSPIPQMM